MLQSQSRIYQTNTFETPPHFETFAERSIEVVQEAHMGLLTANPSSLRTSNDRDAHRVFIERALSEASRDYELLAIHLGAATLTVCMEHRHDHQRDPREYQRSTLVFERGEVRAHYSNLVRLGPIETVTDNKEIGQQMTDRLFHALGTLGVATEVSAYDLSQAS